MVHTQSIKWSRVLLGNNRPDVVITEGKVTIIDVTCPFKNGHEALREAAQRKVDKYSYLIGHFNSLGMSAKVFGRDRVAWQQQFEFWRSVTRVSDGVCGHISMYIFLFGLFLLAATVFAAFG